MSTVPCPQQPLFSFWDACLWLLLWRQSVSFNFFLYLLTFMFSSIIVFSKKPCLLMMCPSRAASVLSFLPHDVSNLICSRTHLFTIPVFLGTCRALLQYCALNKSIFFPSVFFTLQRLHLYIVIENMRVWMIITLVSKCTREGTDE